MSGPGDPEGTYERVLRPLADAVLVRRDRAPTHVGLLEIPEDARERRPETGIVVAVGPGRRRKDGSRQPLTVKAGDRVVIPRLAGLDWSPDYVPDNAREKPRAFADSDVCVLREHELMGVVEPSEP